MRFHKAGHRTIHDLGRECAARIANAFTEPVEVTIYVRNPNRENASGDWMHSETMNLDDLIASMRTLAGDHNTTTYRGGKDS